MAENSIATNASIYASSGLGAKATVAAQGTYSKSVYASVLALGPVQVKRRVKGNFTIDKTLPNEFYGIRDPQSIEISLDNLDQELNFLLRDKAENCPIRVRKYNESTGSLATIFEGTVTNQTVGDEVKLSATDIDLSTFDVELPKYKIVSQGATLPTGLSDLDIVVNYPEAVDTNQPIPLIFGRAPFVPLSLIREDGTAEEYEYLVGEGNLDIEEVYVLKENGPTPKFSVTSRAQSGTTSSITIDSLDAQGSTYDLDNIGFYVGMYITMLEGNCRTQTRLITAYDMNTKVVTVDSAWVGSIVSGDAYIIREYKILAGTPYYGRTALRFKKPQRQDGSLISLYARAVRYDDVIKNQLVYTEGFDNKTLWKDASSLPVYGFSYLGPAARPTGLDDPIGANNAVNLPATATTTGVYQQLPVLKKAGDSDIFSVWVRNKNYTQGPISVTLFATDDGGLLLSGGSTALLSDDTWTRVWAQIDWSADATGHSNYIITIDGTTNQNVHFYGAQLETNNTGVPTWYEAVHDYGQGASFSFASALKYLISSPICLGKPIIESSFDTAINDLGDYYLYCEGSVPTVDGQTFKAKELIDLFCSVRGIQLTKQGSAFGIVVDTPTATTVSTFGTGDTQYKNIKKLGDIESNGVSDTLKTLKLSYGNGFKSDSGQPVLKYEMSYSNSGTIGVEKAEPFDFCQRHVTASAIVQYKAKKNFYSANKLSLTVGQYGSLLEPQDLCAVFMPRRQIENRLQYSESLSTAPWSGSTTAVSQSNESLDPENKSYSPSRFIYTSGTMSLTQSISGDFSNRKIYGSVWVRALGSGATVSFFVKSPIYSSLVTPVHIGQGWRKLQAERILPGGSGASATWQLDVTAGTTLFIWGAQLGVDFKRSYIRTTNTPEIPQDLWRVSSIKQNSISDFDLVMTPYNSNVYTINAITYPITGTEPNTIDSRTVPPLPPTNLSVPPDPPFNTASAGVELSPEGVANSWGEVQFTFPTSNCVSVKIQRRFKDTTSSINYNTWEDCATASVSEFGLGQNGKVRIHGFTPGRPYEIRAVSYNSAGLSTANDSDMKIFVPRGDTTPPSPATGLTVAQGTGRAIQVAATLPLYTTVVNGVTNTTTISKLTDDLAVVRFHRTSVVTGGPAPANPNGGTFTPTEVDRRTTTQFTDVNGITVGFDYYYWVRLEDYTGNISPYFPDGAGSNITPSYNVAADITVSTLTFDKLVLSSPDNMCDNANFEKKAVGWNFAGITYGGSSISSSGEAYNGDWNYRFPNTTPAVAMTLTSNVVNIKQGEQLYAEGFLRARAGFTPNASATAYVAIQWLDKNLATLSYSTGNAITPVFTYTKSLVKGTAPANAVWARFAFCCNGATTGNFLADEAYFRRVIDPSVLGPIIIDNVSAAAADSIKVIASTGSEIGFYADLSTRVSTIDGTGSSLLIRPDSSNGATLWLGTNSRSWKNVHIESERLELGGAIVTSSPGALSGAIKYLGIRNNGVTYWISAQTN